jgi:hypothetical protein
MRCMLKIEIDTEAGNKAITDGSLPKVMEQVAGQIKPEAAYFTTDNGNRTAFYIFDMTDPAQMPAIAEPAFMNLNARVTIVPVMNQDDLQRGLSQLG